MKVIDFEEVRKIAKNTKPKDWYNWVDDVLRHKNDFEMPVKSRINQDDGDYYAIMPCMYKKENLAMVKMIGRHILKKNEKRSVMMSDMLLYEADTGVLKALMDGELITTLRAGAAAAHSVMILAKKDFHTIGLIGLGNIMTICVEVLLSLVNNRTLTIKLYKHNQQEIRFIERFSKYNNVKFILCDTYRDTIKGSEVIISAVTRATENFCSVFDYDKGCTVFPIMTLGFQNCDIFFDKVYTDEIEQIRGFKYFDKFKSITNISDVLNNSKLGRESDDERIIVYNYGLAIHDLYFANQIYLRSKKNEEVYRYCTEKYFV